MSARFGRNVCRENVLVCAIRLFEACGHYELCPYKRCVPRCRLMCPVVSPYAFHGVAVCVPRCVAMRPAVWPYVSGGVAVCVPRCRRMCPTMSPYVSGGVTVCVPRCRRMRPAVCRNASGGVALCVPRVRLTPLRRAPARDFCYARNALCARALHAALPFAVFRAAVCRLSCRKRHPFARPKAAFRAPAIFDTHAALPSTIIKGAPSESPACRRTHAGAPRYIIPIDKTLLSIHTN